ncbi:MAG: hypothetical protein NTX15_10415, partial [Candidatus Kapabacteria bacterium]|nr:hypothetical protein [Candidatus Kapabacteria bacterium]
MNRTAVTISIFVVAMFVSSCNYFEFTMQEYTGWPVQTRILNDRHNVTRPAPNTVHLDGDARIGMRCMQITDGIFTTEIKLNMGSTLRLQTRTTPYDDSTAFQRGMVIDITDGLTTVMINGTTQQTP